MRQATLLALVLFVVAVSTFAQTPTLNVYENFEGGANGQTLTTSILNAGLVCNNAAGVWTLTGNAATQMQVATAAEAPLPTPITACGQVFSPPDGTRGVTYNLNTSSVGYAQFTWTATSNNASLGAWFKTDLPTSDTNYHSMLAISDGTGDFAGLMIHNGFFYLEAGVNPNGNPNVGSFFPYTANKWYWVSEQFQAYVSSSSMHSLAIFDCGTPQTPVLPCTQLSLQKKFTATFGTVKPNFFVVGKDGDTGTPSNFVYYDNLLGDTTGQTFPILPNSGPLIAGLSQTVGAIGTSITITGANFGTPQGTSSVTFNGTTAAPSSWSPTSIVVPVPPGATTGNVVVTVNALPSNGVNFTVTSLPTITALTPASGPVGTLVTISGANFGSSQPSSTVTFNNTPATPTSWSDTGISVPVPGGSTSGSVLVNVAGVVSNGMNFAVTSGAPIALVQHTNLDAGTTTKASLAFKSNNTAGNWIAVAVRAGSSSSQVFTITDSNGNTYRSAFQLGIASSTYAFALFYAENIKSGANTITVSDTVSGPLRFAISEYSGVAKSNSLDGTPATATATNALANSGNLTTTASGDLLLAAIVTHNSATFVAGSGYTIEDSVPAEPNTKLITEDEIQLSAGAVSATAALGASDTWGAGLAAFKPAASGGVAGTPASISATAGTPQSATINTSFTIQLQATVKDSSNNPVSGVIVTFNAPSSGASGSFAGGVSTAITNASGVAVSAVFMANTTAGAYTVTASVPGVASSANFSLINLAGQAASIVATAGTPQSATVNTAFPVQLQGTVKDSFNNPVSGVVVTFAAPSSGPSGTFALGTSTALTDAQGIATAAIFTANGMIGAYTVSASVSGVSAPANFSLTNLSNPAASIAPTSGTPQSVTVNSAFVAPLQVTVLDAFDNPVSGATVTFTPPNSGPSGIFAGGVNTARTNAQGIATAPTFTANSIAGGPYALTASVSGVPTNAAFSLTNLAGVASNIVLVQHTSKDAGTATTTSLAFGKPNVAGNWIAVVIRAGNSSSQVFKVTDSNGNTYRQAIQFGQTTAKDTLGIFYSESIKGGANTVTVSDNVSGILRVVILEYSGVAPANSIDGTAAAQGSNASPNSGPLTTTAGGDLLLGAVITFNSGTFIAGAGYTIEDLVPAEPNTKLIDEDQVQKAAATVSAGASLTASDNWAAGLVGFKAATGVGGASPTIAGLAPSAGAVGTSVTITGLNFGTPQGTSTLSFNGTPATPSSWTSTRIVVPVPGGATSGNVVVTVGGVASNAVNFSVTPPPPTITDLSPSSAVAGSVAFTLIVTGTNFVSSSAVLWNGLARSTVFISSTQLQATITGVDIASAGVARVAVSNASLGGGVSNTSQFLVGTEGGSNFAVIVVNQPAQDIAYDPKNQVFYLSVPATASTNPNTISVLDPATASVISTQPAGNNPNVLAISGDNQFLYVGIDGASSVQRFLLPGLAPDISYLLGANQLYGPYFALDLQVAPGAPHTTAVALGNTGVSPAAQGGIAIFDDAVPRSTTAPGNSPLYDSIQWGADASTLFAANNESENFDFYALAVNASGVALNKDFKDVFGSFSNRIHFDAGTNLVYADDGHAINPSTGLPAGNFNASGAVVVDSSVNSAFFVNAGSGATPTITSFDLTHFTPISSISFPNIAPSPRRVIRWGQHGLAFVGDPKGSGKVVLLAGDFVNPAPPFVLAQPPTPSSPPVPAPNAPTITSLNPSSAVAGSAALVLNVAGTNFDPTANVHFNGTALATTFVSSTQLQATIPVSSVAAPGTASIVVVNPPTNGGNSGPATFFVGSSRGTSSAGTGFAVQILNQASKEIVFDAADQLFYLTVPNSAPTGNTIAVLDPVTATIVGQQFAGSNPNAIRVSDDHQFLYAGIDGSSSVRRFTLPSLQTDISYSLGAGSLGPFVALDLRVAPGAPRTTAVTLADTLFSPVAQGGIAIFDDATPRPTRAPGLSSLFDSIQWGPDATSLFAANNESSSSDFYTLSVTASGVSLVNDSSNVFSTLRNNKIHFDPGTKLIYADDGHVVDPATGLSVGSFPVFGPMVPDSALNLAFFAMAETGSKVTIQAFDLTHFTPVSSITISGVAGNPLGLIRWGQNGLAFNTDLGQVVLVGGNFIH